MAQWEKPERLLRAFAQYSLEMAHLSYGVDLSELIADGWCDACLLGGGRVLFSASAERASISRYKKLQDEMERRFRPKAGRAILATRMLPNGLGAVSYTHLVRAPSCWMPAMAGATRAPLAWRVPTKTISI